MLADTNTCISLDPGLHFFRSSLANNTKKWEQLYDGWAASKKTKAVFFKAERWDNEGRNAWQKGLWSKMAPAAKRP